MPSFEIEDLFNISGKKSLMYGLKRYAPPGVQGLLILCITNPHLNLFQKPDDNNLTDEIWKTHLQITFSYYSQPDITNAALARAFKYSSTSIKYIITNTLSRLLSNAKAAGIELRLKQHDRVKNTKET